MFSYLQYTRLLLSLYDFFIEQIIGKFQIAFVFLYFWNKSLYLDIFISILNVGRKWQRCLRSLASSVCVAHCRISFSSAYLGFITVMRYITLMTLNELHNARSFVINDLHIVIQK